MAAEAVGRTGATNGGILDTTAGPPVIDFAGNIPYNDIGQSGWPGFGFLVNNRWQFSNDLTWVKGRHTLKTGFEFRHHDFPFRGWAAGNVAGNFQFNRLGTAGFDASGNNLGPTGDPFASFLLGQVQQASQTIPAQPTFRETCTGVWVNDEFKVSDKLTLTLGLRFDYQSARTETQDRYSTFSPTAPNPGAGGIPGALIFAGEGPGLAGVRKFEDVPKDAWGPRVGFAYRLNDKQALRGGYGIYYAHVAFDQFVGQPTTGFQANALAPNTTNGIEPAFHLDRGFPQDRIFPPPTINPTQANNTGVIAVTPDGLTLPRFQNWSVTYQRQITDNMMLDVSYIGNRGSRLNHHWERKGVDANMNHPDVLALGTPVLQSNINSPLAQGAGILPPYPGFNGNVAQALRRFPQYQGIIWRGVPLGNSQYHALEMVLERHFSRGFQARFGYTFSRLKNNGAESAQGDNGINGGVQNPADALEYGLSGDDTPHVFLTGFTWQVPGPESGLGKVLLGDWNVVRNSPVRKRPPLECHDEQRPRWPSLQQSEAAQSRRWRPGGQEAETSIRLPTTTSIGTPGRIRVRSRSATRRSKTGTCAASPTSVRTSISSRCSRSAARRTSGSRCRSAISSTAFSTVIRAAPA